MKQDIGLNIQQQQKLILTNELRQSIELLQLNQLELLQKINNELEENPLLEKIEKLEYENIEENDNNHEEKIEYLEYLERNDYREKASYSNNDNEENKEFLNYYYDDLTLKDELLFQLNLLHLKDKEEFIILEIIKNINDNGYLEESTENISKKLNIEVSYILQCLKIVQSFYPRGVGARNLKECLVLQIDNDDIITREIINNHLEDIAENRLNNISKKMNLSLKEVNEKVNYIKTLNPKPGSSYQGSEDTIYIVPDAKIEKIGEKYIAKLTDNYIPELYIPQKYINYLKFSDKETKDYINKKINRASWFINSIEQRRSTILSIVREISITQIEFFEKGIKKLKPMSQKDMAKKLEVHPSTISRATTNKYVDTPMGIYELKFFFSNTIVSDLGEEISDKAIKEKIREIIENENPYKPLSDEKIRKKLLDIGYKISRRTVAKYREDINIPSSSKRKQYK